MNVRPGPISNPPPVTTMVWCIFAANVWPSCPCLLRRGSDVRELRQRNFERARCGGTRARCTRPWSSPAVDSIWVRASRSFSSVSRRNRKRPVGDSEPIRRWRSDTLRLRSKRTARLRSLSVRPDRPRGSRLGHTEACTSGDHRCGPKTRRATTVVKPLDGLSRTLVPPSPPCPPSCPP